MKLTFKTGVMIKYVMLSRTAFEFKLKLIIISDTVYRTDKRVN